jgi:60 kDa SS-A/Ro ribonucleoprotein
MANQSLFASIRGKLLPRPDTTNQAGAPAHAFSPKHRLAQAAMTGTVQPTFYATAEMQLAEILAAIEKVEPKFLAQAAIYARQKGHMKDVPALLLAALSSKDSMLFARAFPRVVDNGRMLRTFVQIMRSGAVGRKSLGSRPKRMVEAWIEQASIDRFLQAAVGQQPSLADVIKMVHPKPNGPERAALYAWAIGKPYDVKALPQRVQQFEAFKRGDTKDLPDVPFQMLTALELKPKQWAQIARTGGWQMLRMNLNTFARQGAFEIDGVADMVARRLVDKDAIAKARVLPYQLMAAYKAAGENVPLQVREALQDAMEVALQNVPEIAGRVIVCPDVSGSMQSPVTGHRKGATTSVRCIDVAALVAAAMLRVNRGARVLPFEQAVVDLRLNGRDSVMTNATKLASIGGGGTNCSAPLELLNKESAKADLVVFISDNESWVDAKGWRNTGLMAEWTKLKRRNPGAKLVCIDIQPNATTQAPDSGDILNVGGFSDAVFEVMASFAKAERGAKHWVAEIEAIEV